MKIDGKEIAQHIFDTLTTQVKELIEDGVTPHLAVVLVGDDESSKAYVRQKELKIGLIGAAISVHRLSQDTTEDELLKLIAQLNHEPTIHGVIIQRPLPPQINGQTITDATDVTKDVDGFSTNSPFDPPIALAVWKILKDIHHRTPSAEERMTDWLRNKKIVILGKGPTAGGPIASYFKKMQIPLSVIDSKTEKREELLSAASIIISAVGKRGVLKNVQLKHDVIVIGVGMFKNDEGKLEGDYLENEVIDAAEFYTSVPGGVGPVNVAMLLSNLVNAAQTKNSS